MIKLSIWSAAILGVLWVASHTKLGPTVLVLSARHGVHLGDVAAAIAAVAAATVLSLVDSTVGRRRERPREASRHRA